MLDGASTIPGMRATRVDAIARNGRLDPGLHERAVVGEYLERGQRDVVAVHLSRFPVAPRRPAPRAAVFRPPAAARAARPGCPLRPAAGKCRAGCPPVSVGFRSGGSAAR